MPLKWAVQLLVAAFEHQLIAHHLIAGSLGPRLTRPIRITEGNNINLSAHERLLVLNRSYLLQSNHQYVKIFFSAKVRSSE